jgi:hypothetical protein
VSLRGAKRRSNLVFAFPRVIASEAKQSQEIATAAFGSLAMTLHGRHRNDSSWSHCEERSDEAISSLPSLVSLRAEGEAISSLPSLVSLRAEDEAISQ